MARNGRNGNEKRLATKQPVNGAVKSICDIMRRSNCAGALQYVPELIWILFLRILDEQETKDVERAEAIEEELNALNKLPAAVLRRAFSGAL
jgi:type I restriction enzyme M protein